MSKVHRYLAQLASSISASLLFRSRLSSIVVSLAQSIFAFLIFYCYRVLALDLVTDSISSTYPEREFFSAFSLGYVTDGLLS